MVNRYFLADKSKKSFHLARESVVGPELLVTVALLTVEPKKEDCSRGAFWFCVHKLYNIHPVIIAETQVKKATQVATATHLELRLLGSK